METPTSFELLQIALQAATSACDVLMSGFGATIASQSKSNRHDLVTAYDLRSEDCIRAMLLQAVPNSSFLGEEGGTTIGSNSLTWIVDPLDGTVNFAHGIPLFSVSIAASLDGIVKAGVVMAPALGETWLAYEGGGATLNGKPVSVSETLSLQDSLLVTGFPYNVSENPGSCVEQFTKLLLQGMPIRRLGSAALDLAWVAGGRFDGFWEVELHPWDMAAGALIVAEAGGQVTQYNGNQFAIKRGSIVATNGHIHRDLVDCLREDSGIE